MNRSDSSLVPNAVTTIEVKAAVAAHPILRSDHRHRTRGLMRRVDVTTETASRVRSQDSVHDFTDSSEVHSVTITHDLFGRLNRVDPRANVTQGNVTADMLVRHRKNNLVLDDELAGLDSRVASLVLVRAARQRQEFSDEVQGSHCYLPQSMVCLVGQAQPSAERAWSTAV